MASPNLAIFRPNQSKYPPPCPNMAHAHGHTRPSQRHAPPSQTLLRVRHRHACPHALQTIRTTRPTPRSPHTRPKPKQSILGQHTRTHPNPKTRRRSRFKHTRTPPTRLTRQTRARLLQRTRRSTSAARHRHLQRRTPIPQPITQHTTPNPNPSPARRRTQSRLAKPTPTLPRTTHLPH